MTKRFLLSYKFDASNVICDISGKHPEYDESKHEWSNYIRKNRLKRLVDVVVSVFLLIPFALFILPVSIIMIKASSRGPVFFTQKRSGMNNRVFHCYKLRTMRVNKEADIQQATASDQRITSTGYFMRIFYIDEWPQLFNVLKGEMSLVGPRPHMLQHTSQFACIIPGYHERLQCKPGITGLAQIKGYVGEIRNEKDLKLRVLSDIYYVRNATFQMDIYILTTTILYIFKKIREFIRTKPGKS